MTLEIREGDFDAFFRAPFECYGNDAYLSSPLKDDLRKSLDPKLNPLWQDGRGRVTFFTAHRDSVVVGRITAHIHDASNALYGTQRGYFGMFDCVDDADVARALLAASASWCRERDCNEHWGPFNLTITQMIGALTDGFDSRPYTYQDWSPPHIARLLSQLGYAATYPSETFEIDVRDAQALIHDSPKIEKLKQDARWEFRTVRKSRLRDELLVANEILNDSFAKNPMFVPLTDAEFIFPSEGMKLIMDESLTRIAFCDGEPAAIVLCIPDLNPMFHAMGYRIGWRTPLAWWRHRKAKRAAVIFYAVKQKFHGLGVNSALLHDVLRSMNSRGYESLGVSWVSQSNVASIGQLQKLGAKKLHSLSLFHKDLA